MFIKNAFKLILISLFSCFSANIFAYTYKICNESDEDITIELHCNGLSCPKLEKRALKPRSSFSFQWARLSLCRPNLTCIKVNGKNLPKKCFRFSPCSSCNGETWILKKINGEIVAYYISRPSPCRKSYRFRSNSRKGACSRSRCRYRG